MDKNMENVLSQLRDRFLFREYFRPNQNSLTMKLLAAPYCCSGYSHSMCGKKIWCLLRPQDNDAGNILSVMLAGIDPMYSFT